MSLRVVTLYERIGGEATVDRLTRRFYELMDTLPEAARCRAIHPPSLETSREKLFEYLTGWLGGPPLFTDKYGAPMLRARHLRAPIGTAEADEWLLCFERALDETVDDEAARETIRGAVRPLALHMRNES